jgi:RNA polymerase sigma-B factor
VAAVNRFDPDRGGSFRGFAVPTMLGELRRHFRDAGWGVRVPRPLQERARRVGIALDELSTKLGRSPSAKEIGTVIGATSEEVVEALEVRHCYQPPSLDAAFESDDGQRGSRLDSYGDPGDPYENYDRVDLLGRAMKSLPARERLIVRLRFEEDLSQSEIGDHLGISQMHVSRLLRRALERMSVVLAGV